MVTETRPCFRRVIGATLVVALVGLAPREAIPRPLERSPTQFVEPAAAGQARSQIVDQQIHSARFIELRSDQHGLVHVAMLDGAKPQAVQRRCVAPISDVNRDGVMDVLVGVPDANRVYVFHGPAMENSAVTVGRADAAMILVSPNPADFDFGEQVAAVRDVGGDGVHDIRIRARFRDGNGAVRMRTYVVSAADGSLLIVIDENESFDPWMQLAGDVDGDADVDEQDRTLVMQQMQTVIDDTALWSGDVNGDGIVNEADLAIVQAGMGGYSYAVGGDVDCVNPPVGFLCGPSCTGSLVLLPPGTVMDCGSGRVCLQDCGCLYTVTPTIPGSFGTSLEVGVEATIWTMPHGGLATNWEVLQGGILITFFDADEFSFIPLHTCQIIIIRTSYGCCQSPCTMTILMSVPDPLFQCL